MLDSRTSRKCTPGQRFITPAKQFGGDVEAGGEPDRTTTLRISRSPIGDAAGNDETRDARRPAAPPGNRTRGSRPAAIATLRARSLGWRPSPAMSSACASRIWTRGGSNARQHGALPRSDRLPVEVPLGVLASSRGDSLAQVVVREQRLDSLREIFGGVRDPDVDGVIQAESRAAAGGGDNGALHGQRFQHFEIGAGRNQRRNQHQVRFDV